MIIWIYPDKLDINYAREKRPYEEEVVQDTTEAGKRQEQADNQSSTPDYGHGEDYEEPYEDNLR